jgi:Na+-transporting NADH:ubiquinone oxidoreductase subunit NqrC
MIASKTVTLVVGAFSLLCSVRLAAAAVALKTKKSRVHRPRFKAVAAASAALVDTPGSAIARSFNCRSLGSTIPTV